MSLVPGAIRGSKPLRHLPEVVGVVTEHQRGQPFQRDIADALQMGDTAPGALGKRAQPEYERGPPLHEAGNRMLNRVPISAWQADRPGSP